MRSSLLIAFLLAASAPAALAASSPSGPIVKDGVEITILPTLGAAGASGGLIQVGLDLEARSDDAAKRLGFRSLRAETSVDCRAGSNRFLNAQAFAEPGLKGHGVSRVVSGAWVHPNDNSYMSEVTARICAAAGPAAATQVQTSTPASFAATRPAPVVTSAALAPPAPAKAAALPVVTSPAPSPAVAAPPPARTASANPQPAAHAFAPSAAPTAQAAVNAPPAPKTAHAFAPPKSAPAAQAAVTQAAVRPAGHAAVAQVAASPDPKDAQRVLTALRAMITPPLTGSVDPAVVQNAHIFRASVSGFSSMAEAEAFCARAAHVSKTCWVHR